MNAKRILPSPPYQPRSDTILRIDTNPSPKREIMTMFTSRASSMFRLQLKQIMLSGIVFILLLFVVWSWSVTNSTNSRLSRHEVADAYNRALLACRHLEHVDTSSKYVPMASTLAEFKELRCYGNESHPVRNLMEKKIRSNQYAPDQQGGCNEEIALITWPVNGFASDLSVLSRVLEYTTIRSRMSLDIGFWNFGHTIPASAMDEVYNHRVRLQTLNTISGCGSSEFECYFEPLSSCNLRRSAAEDRERWSRSVRWIHPRDRGMEVLYGQLLTTSSQSEDTQELQFDFQQTSRATVLFYDDFKTVLPEWQSITNENFFHGTVNVLRASILGTLFTPHETLRAEMNNISQALDWPRWNNGDNWSTPVIGVHIRRGDACLRRKDGCREISSYVNAVLELSKQYGYDTVFVASDDSHAIGEFRKSISRRHGLTVMFQEIDRSKYVPGEGVKPRHARVEERLAGPSATAEERKQLAHEMLVDMYLMAHCEAFVIQTHRSFGEIVLNWSLYHKGYLAPTILV